MFLFLTLVLSQYNEVIFLHRDNIIDSLGFAFESDLEKDSPDFKISHINPYVFPTSLDESPVTLVKRYNKENYSLFLIDISKYDYDWFKDRYFVFQGILPNTILSTPVMRSLEVVFFHASSEDSEDDAYPMSKNLEDIIAPTFHKVGLKEEFIDDFFDEDVHIFGDRTIMLSLSKDNDLVSQKNMFSDFISRDLPFLTNIKHDEIPNNKKIVIQNKSETEREEYFTEVLNDEEKKFRDCFFEETSSSDEEQGSSMEKSSENFLRKVKDTFSTLSDNADNN